MNTLNIEQLTKYGIWLGPSVIFGDLTNVFFLCTKKKSKKCWLRIKQFCCKRNISLGQIRTCFIALILQGTTWRGFSNNWIIFITEYYTVGSNQVTCSHWFVLSHTLDMATRSNLPYAFVISPANVANIVLKKEHFHISAFPAPLSLEVLFVELFVIMYI